MLYGGGNGLTAVGRELWYEGRISVTGPAAAGDHFGSALASGDFNQDGYSDLAIGIPFKTTFAGTHSGAVVVLYGSVNGLTTTDSTRPPRMFDLSPANTPRQPSFWSSSFTLHLGLCGRTPRLLLGLGGFNGDGAGDLAIGAPGFALVAGARVVKGAIWEWHGGPPGASNGGLTLSGNRLSTPWQSLFSDDDFGATLAGGDFNGDGYIDLAVGVPHGDVRRFDNTIRTDAGIVFIYMGSSGGLHDVGLRSWSQDHFFPDVVESDDHFGAALAAGDFNGDG